MELPNAAINSAATMSINSSSLIPLAFGREFVDFDLKENMGICDCLLRYYWVHG